MILLAVKAMLWFVIVCDVLILARREQQLRCDEGCTDILLSPVETVQRDLMEFARCHAGNVLSQNKKIKWRHFCFPVKSVLHFVDV